MIFTRNARCICGKLPAGQCPGLWDEPGCHYDPATAKTFWQAANELSAKEKETVAQMWRLVDVIALVFLVVCLAFLAADVLYPFLPGAIVP